MRKPFFNVKKNAWYVWVRDKQVRLVEGKANESAAFDVWQEMRVAGELENPNVTVFAICEAFIEWSEKNQAQRTTEWYGEYLANFCNVHGATAARRLKKIHVTRWLDDHGWQGSRRRAGITSVSRAMNWAVEQGLLNFNPVAKMKRPESGKREVTIDDATHRRMLDLADKGHKRQYRRGAFRLLLISLRLSGCRPGELRAVTAAHFEPRAATWKFEKHKTATTTRKARIVHLTPCMETISRILSHHRPQGELFLNGEGKPWTANAIRCRMKRIREELKLPAGTVAYSYRHTFTTEGMLNGVGIATMAELLGHQDTRMISRHYGHLDQHSKHLKQAAGLAAQKQPQPLEPPSGP